MSIFKKNPQAKEQSDVMDLQKSALKRETIYVLRTGKYRQANNGIARVQVTNGRSGIFPIEGIDAEGERHTWTRTGRHFGPTGEYGNQTSGWDLIEYIE